jgi:hypothetical protein
MTINTASTSQLKVETWPLGTASTDISSAL